MDFLSSLRSHRRQLTHTSYLLYLSVSVTPPHSTPQRLPHPTNVYLNPELLVLLLHPKETCSTPWYPSQTYLDPYTRPDSNKFPMYLTHPLISFSGWFLRILLWDPRHLPSHLCPPDTVSLDRKSQQYQSRTRPVCVLCTSSENFPCMGTPNAISPVSSPGLVGVSYPTPITLWSPLSLGLPRSLLPSKGPWTFSSTLGIRVTLRTVWGFKKTLFQPYDKKFKYTFSFLASSRIC